MWLLSDIGTGTTWCVATDMPVAAFTPELELDHPFHSFEPREFPLHPSLLKLFPGRPCLLIHPSSFPSHNPNVGTAAARQSARDQLEVLMMLGRADWIQSKIENDKIYTETDIKDRRYDK